METSVPRSTFDSAYESHSAPWVIGEPQPAVVDLERDGWIRGTVLDPGCGTGEHTIYLASLGYEVLGVDFSARAVEQARANAAERQVTARFEVADALSLGGGARFDTVVDSALFHVFGPEDRDKYVQSLHAVCRPGALVHVLALSDVEPDFGPTVSETVLREAFGAGWTWEDLRPSQYRGVTHATYADKRGLRIGERVDVPAWLARVRRR